MLACSSAVDGKVSDGSWAANRGSSSGWPVEREIALSHVGQNEPSADTPRDWAMLAAAPVPTPTEAANSSASAPIPPSCCQGSAAALDDAATGWDTSAAETERGATACSTGAAAPVADTCGSASDPLPIPETPAAGIDTAEAAFAATALRFCDGFGWVCAVCESEVGSGSLTNSRPRGPIAQRDGVSTDCDCWTAAAMLDGRPGAPCQRFADPAVAPSSDCAN